MNEYILIKETKYITIYNDILVNKLRRCYMYTRSLISEIMNDLKLHCLYTTNTRAVN